MSRTDAGRFIWYDQMSNDLKASEAFYKKVVGWTIAPNTMNAQVYSILQAGDAMVGGLMPIPEDAKAMGAKPAWMGYIGVDDVDGYAKKVKATGGTLYREPTDIPNVGRFAVVGDPHGAAFIIMKGQGEGRAADDPTKPGHFGWRELHAGDRERDFVFYSDLFGWEKGDGIDMGPMGIYQIFKIDGKMVGGIMTKTAQTPVPHWLYYITVEGIDAAIERTKAASGTVLNGPMQVPGGSWIAQAIDAQGATFAMSAAKR
jgi:predicted enzyme related to lactoylglutathione lyase